LVGAAPVTGAAPILFAGPGSPAWRTAWQAIRVKVAGVVPATRIPVTAGTQRREADQPHGGDQHRGAQPRGRDQHRADRHLVRQGGGGPQVAGTARAVRAAPGTAIRGVPDGPGRGRTAARSDPGGHRRGVTGLGVAIRKAAERPVSGLRRREDGQRPVPGPHGPQASAPPALAGSRRPTDRLARPASPTRAGIRPRDLGERRARTGAPRARGHRVAAAGPGRTGPVGLTQSAAARRPAAALAREAARRAARMGTGPRTVPAVLARIAEAKNQGAHRADRMATGRTAGGAGRARIAAVSAPEAPRPVPTVSGVPGPVAGPGGTVRRGRPHGATAPGGIPRAGTPGRTATGPATCRGYKSPRALPPQS
jgi:hypothetical protein